MLSFTHKYGYFVRSQAVVNDFTLVDTKDRIHRSGEDELLNAKCSN